jgi:hypothetical protein
MVGFTAWIAQEFPELNIDPDNEREMRLVMIASKAYSYYQATDANKERNQNSVAA